ncbi:MAG: hypothetical protein M9962_11225 [Oligoflexia bacterium]|nr:hypothetical protein [Oligoflexia bacterium]
MDKKKDENIGPWAVGILAVLGCAFYSKHEQMIKVWFYEHTMHFAALGFLIAAGIVVLVLRRIKKKEKDFLKRMAAVEAVKPRAKKMDYYRKGN